MRTLAICRPAAGVSPAEIAKSAAAEMDLLRELHERGLLLEAYSPGGPGAVLVFAGDGEEVDAALEALPLKLAGLIEVERISLRPFNLGPSPSRG
jgi:hypothetical protein